MTTTRTMFVRATLSVALLSVAACKKEEAVPKTTQAPPATQRSLVS